MRMKAIADFEYYGDGLQAGALFNSKTDLDGLDLINRDLAIPFNLEDPSQPLAPPPTAAPSTKP